MSNEMFAVVLTSVVQGYLVLPILQAGVAAGKWLSKQWSDEPLPFATLVNGIVITLALLYVDIVLGIELHRGLGEPFGRVAGGSFTVGIFAYLLIAGYESRFRKQRVKER